ncbi:alpha/beta hydrolase domain-containing protein [Haliea sp. E1-2-M8]|uniref:alpha/beta hydrolase domain-containing protein n=1 Tax=Haliea sp. E1-2-M8 TaxID=3064706 RepID=UPI0027230080|nr:alpha/beta hydrolase domain-containing protein [Haliea sp. E1-2-M8]MDO8863907.1 alpha/beta hydrolase domain-containing protein [Haliea sp. E1-2-M8]
MKLPRHHLGLALGLTAILLAACSDSSDRTPAAPEPEPPPPPPAPTYLPIAQPEVTDPPDAGGLFLLSTTFDLADVGYQQREFFLSGEATAFRNVGELGTDGAWEVETAETATYRTRVVVYQPLDAADFSGTVLVEWLNVTAGFDTGPSYGSAHVEILRQGHVWVGVSTQRVGIEGAETPVAPLHLKAANPERYESLDHPGDSFSYDMFSQAAQALREPGNANLLEGLEVERLIAVGESQSAFRLVTYINAVHPLYNTFDGYLVHSRGDGSAALTQSPLEPIGTPESVLIRDDLNVPVFNFQTETDVFLLGSITERQPDTDRFRLWEVAGTAHGDYYSFIIGREDTGEDPRFLLVDEANGIPGFLSCARPVNAGPMAWTLSAALRALVTWVRDGTAPPTAERLAVDDASSAFLKDDLGNVLGGVRTPWVDAPVATLSGEGQEGDRLCFLFGTTVLFDAAQMASLYVDQAGYEAAVSEALDEAIAGGFLLQEDADRIRAVAPLQWQSQVPGE